MGVHCQWYLADIICWLLCTIYCWCKSGLRYNYNLITSFRHILERHLCNIFTKLSSRGKDHVAANDFHWGVKSKNCNCNSVIVRFQTEWIEMIFSRQFLFHSELCAFLAPCHKVGVKSHFEGNGAFTQTRRGRASLLTTAIHNSLFLPPLTGGQLSSTGGTKQEETMARNGN